MRAETPAVTPDVPRDAQGRVASPCRNLCQLDEARRWCLGCRRSLDEIANWSRLNDAQRQAVWLALPGRDLPVPPQN